jgi:membrane protease YdiL (CAAX protease family)
VLSFAQRPELEAQIQEFPRRSIYLSSAIALWLLAAIAILSALASGFSPRLMGLVLLEPLPLLGWTLGLLTLCVMVPVVSRFLRIRETTTVDWILPRTRREKLEFVGLSGTAGVAEELIFRAFLVPALIMLTGSTTVAVVASSLAFGSVHAYQGFIGILRTAFIGGLLTLPLLVSGSIIPSMLAHAFANIVVGVVLSDWFRRES